MATRKQELEEVISYTPPKLYKGKEWYIGFKAYDPAAERMRRKKMKVNHIPRIKERTIYANDLIIRLNDQLRRGWNPWVAREDVKSYQTIDEAIVHFKKLQKKYWDDEIIREDTYVEYCSKMNNLQAFIKWRKVPSIYIYQVDAQFIQEFLDYIYIERNNTAQTRDNNLRVMSVFCKFLVAQGYHKADASAPVALIGKKQYQKGRKTIPETELKALTAYLTNKNKYYLLACYLEFYCFIRPKELSMLKIKDISFKFSTIQIRSEVGKNRKDAVVTLNKKVIELMIELNMYKYSQECYLFSANFMPGEKHRSGKSFRDYWVNHVRPDLKFPKEYKFYSLKDSGITMMLRTVDTLSTRDQARHSSILMTDKYTPHDIQEANPILAEFDSVF